MRSNPWILVAALALGCRHAAEPEGEDKLAPAEATCQAIAATAIDELVDVAGVIAPPPKLDAIVSSPVAGRVAQVAVDEGDAVAAGALLAVIEDPALGAGAIEARAAVDSASAQKLAVDQEVARQARLEASGIGARKDLDDARAKQAAAVADLATARARLGLADAQLARREVRAPRAGVVLRLQRKVGESVDGTAATPLAEIADIRTLELHAQAPPAALRALRDGMPATIRTPSDPDAIAGTVVRVAPAVDPTTLLGTVRIALAHSDGIKVGVAATAQIAVAQRVGVQVPASALRRSLVGDDEVVVCANGAAHARKVTVGARGARGVAITEGLAAGEQIVVDRVLGLQDDQPLVAPAESATQSATKSAAGSDTKSATGLAPGSAK